MDVLSFISEDDNVVINVSTAADMAKCWLRFRSRVGENAMSYCDYRTTLQGLLSLALPPNFSTSPINETICAEWKELPPVFYETATYNIVIHLKGIATEPQVLHKMKEVTELFTAIPINKEKSEWLLSAPLSFINQPGIFDLKFKYQPIGKPERTDVFSFRVVSPKLDTKEDYNHILAEINAQYNEIIYQYLTLDRKSVV